MKKLNLPYLQIEPSTVCNYTCGFCVGRHMAQRHITLDTFQQVLESIYGLKHISIQGEGEPLLNPQFFDMVKIVRLLHPDASVSFITNGSLFSAENVDHILSNRIARIMVSIESADSATFKEIRGGKLEKVTKGIRMLLKERSRQGLTSPVVGFAVTIMKRTMNDFKDIVSLYHDLELDGGIACQYLQQMEIYSNIYDNDMKTQMLSSSEISWFDELRSNSPEIKQLSRLADNDSNFYTNLLGSESEGCPWLENGLFVNTAGIATGCCQIKEAETRGFGILTEFTSEVVAAKRSEMQTQLISGLIPGGCANCPIAISVQDNFLLKQQSIV